MNSYGTAEDPTLFPLENPNPVFRAAADGLILFANQASDVLLEWLGTSAGEVLPPLWRERIAAVLTSSKGQRLTERCGERVFELDLVPIASRGYVNVYGRDVSEQEAARQSLAAAFAATARSEAQYRLLFDSIDEGFCVIEVLFDESGKPVDYVILEANQAFERQTGLANAVGRRVREMVPLHEEHWFVTYGRIALTGQPERFENVAEQLNRYYDVYALRIGEAAERKVAVFFKDIGERKRAEALDRERSEAIARQNAMLNGINRILQLAINAEDEETLGMGCLEVAEQVTQSKFGFLGEINEQTGRLDYIATSDASWQASQMGSPTRLSRRMPGGFAIHAIYRRVLLDGKGFYTNDPSSHPDGIGMPPGDPPLTAILGVPLVHGGKTIGMVGLGNRPGGYTPHTLEMMEALAPSIVQALLFRRAHDELEQRVAERTGQLTRANEALRYQATVLENVNDAIIAYDAADLRITAWNRRAEEQYGWTAQEALGGYAPSVVGSQLDPETRAEIVKMVAATGRWRGELRHTRRDGTPIVVETTSTALHDEAGRVVGHVTANRDISERKRMEEELRASREQLKNLAHRLVKRQESERSFVANELYNDESQRLAALLLEIGLMEKAAKANGALEDHIERMRQLAGGILADMHTLAVSLRPASLDRLGLMAALRDYAQELGVRSGVKLQVEVSGPKEMQVAPDCETMVYRIAQEAVTNAVRHAGASHIGIVATQRADHLVVVVDDNGQGFAVEEAVRRGALGLLSMRERAEMLGGELAIESTLGEGTSVYIKVPLSKGHSFDF